jgi:hypothetical protein
MLFPSVWSCGKANLIQQGLENEDAVFNMCGLKEMLI